VRTVHHGLPGNELQLRMNPENHVAFLGRISIEKRVDRAIEIAKRAKLPLRIAAKVDPSDRGYFEHVIQPMLDHPLIEFIGEIGLQEKNDFLGNARALLFPIDWPEPFGLVMIEAMACGTPVIAFRGGSVAEVVENGVSGFIVDTIEEAVDAIGRLGEIDRRDCRAWFEERFQVGRMVDDYLAVYERVISDAKRLKAAS
jgi:glycosyltransferase involved in cell wall biosynthesis